MKNLKKNIILSCIILGLTTITIVIPVLARQNRSAPYWNYNLDIYDVDKVDSKITGKGVYIAILDSGFTSYWKEFIPENSIKWGWARRFHDRGMDVEVMTGEYPGPDIVESRDIVASNDEWLDEGHHSTKVISYITGWYYNDQMLEKYYFFRGIAPGAKIIPIKVKTAYNIDEEWGEWWSDASMAAGIDYIIQLAELHPDNRFVIYIGAGVGSPLIIPDTMDAIDRATEAGIVFVAPAGNSGFIPPGVPENFRSMGYPAAYSPVISVGAAVYADGVPWEGNYQGAFWPFDWMNDPPTYFNELAFMEDVPEGDNGQLCAVALGSSRGFPDQDLDILGVGMFIAGPGKKYDGQSEDAARLYYYDDTLEYGGGTSGTAAQVAGIIALILQANPNLSPNEVEQILENSADFIPPAGLEWALVPPMSGFPDGILLPNPWGTLLNMFFPWLSDEGLDVTGAGLVQADTAVEMALAF